MQVKKWKPGNCPVGFARFMFKMSVLFKSVSLEVKERKICEIEVYDFVRF